MTLKERKYKLFKLSEYFEFVKFKGLKMDALKPGTTPLFSAKINLKGLYAYVSNATNILEKTIIITKLGKVSYVHEKMALANTITLAIRHPKINNKYVGTFISAVMQTLLNKKGHSHSVGASYNLLKNYFLPLPIDENGNIDYDFMENYIKEKWAIKFEMMKNNDVKNDVLDLSNWKKFKLGDFFTINKNNKKYSFEQYKYNNGLVAFVGNKYEHFGIMRYVDLPSIAVPCLTVSLNNNSHNSFWHTKPIVLSKSTEALYIKPEFEKLLPWNSIMVIVAQLSWYKKNFPTTKLTNGKALNVVIKMPIDEYGNIDFEYLSYLTYKRVVNVIQNIAQKINERKGIIYGKTRIPIQKAKQNLFSNF